MKEGLIHRIIKKLNTPYAKHSIKSFAKYLVLFIVVILFYIYATQYIYNNFLPASEEKSGVDSVEAPLQTQNKSNSGPKVAKSGIKVQPS